jgi:hypothetical protein
MVSGGFGTAPRFEEILASAKQIDDAVNHRV